VGVCVEVGVIVFVGENEGVGVLVTDCVGVTV
jgi:hypothetical protein